MELLMSFLGVMFRFIALVVIAIGTGVYCLWAVLWNKISDYNQRRINGIDSEA